MIEARFYLKKGEKWLAIEVKGSQEAIDELKELVDGGVCRW